MNKKNALILILLLTVIAAIAWFLLISPGRAEIRNVLLISMDTTRADHLSCYGYNRKTTPNIDALAAEGILCEKATSTAPLTLPAHGSIMTGTIPPYHGVHDNLDYQLSEDNLTLAEILKKQGFATGAAISSFVLDSMFNLNQGFDTYNDRFEQKYSLGTFDERKGDETTQVTIQWLDEHKDSPFFYFLHYYDPHSTYVPPEPFAKEYPDDLYAGEIAFTDHCIGKVIDKLKELDLYDSTLIIVVGDHGEMLGEHGEMTHAYYIYESAIKVPLIFKVPGRRRAKTIESNVGIIDIVPTVCSLLGIDPPNDLAGIDLSPFFKKGQPPAERGLYCESLYPTMYNANSLLGIVEGRYKYIQTTRPELYDLKKDPRESINLVTTQPHRARILQEKLSHILESQVRQSDGESGVNLDAEAIKRLESLGYIAGNITEDFSFDQTKDDPKDVLSFHLRNVDVAFLIAQERYSEAESLLNEMVAQRPGFSGIYVKLGELATMRKDFVGVVSHLKEALRLRRDRFEIHNNLALALIHLDKFDEAVEHFQKALILRPGHPQVLSNIAQIRLRQDKIDESIEYSRATLEVDPYMADGHYNLGMALAKNDDFKGAIASYRKSLEIEPNRTSVLNYLGKALFMIEDYHEAINEWNKSLEFKPAQLELHDDIALALINMGKVDEAISEYGKSLEIEPDRVRTLNAIGAAQVSAKRYDDAVTAYMRSLKIKSGQPVINKIVADILYKQGKLAEAVDYYKAALKLKHDMPPAHNSLAEVYIGLGDLDKAVEHWRQALELNPDWIDVLNNLAWMSSVYKNKDFHNPAEAVRLARRACELTNYKATDSLDTLSVAYATTGKFTEAVETAEKAVDIADSEDNKELANDIRKRLELFKASKAYYEDI